MQMHWKIHQPVVSTSTNLVMKMTSNELNEKIEKKDEPDIYLMKGRKILFSFCLAPNTPQPLAEWSGWDLSSSIIPYASVS